MVFVSLLGHAYAEELCLSALHRFILVNFDEEMIWDTFFQLLKDTLKHMQIIVYIVTLMKRDTREFKEDAIINKVPRDFDFSTELIPGLFWEIQKWEKYTLKLYTRIFDHYTEEVEKTLDSDTAKKIRAALISLIRDEERHMELIDALSETHYFAEPEEGSKSSKD
jgi:rubrerythrin